MHTSPFRRILTTSRVALALALTAGTLAAPIAFADDPTPAPQPRPRQAAQWFPRGAVSLPPELFTVEGIYRLRRQKWLEQSRMFQLQNTSNPLSGQGASNGTNPTAGQGAADPSGANSGADLQGGAPAFDGVGPSQ